MWLSIVVCGEKTLQKRRAITIFDQFRLLGNGLWIQLKMTARRANWRLEAGGIHLFICLFIHSQNLIQREQKLLIKL